MVRGLQSYDEDVQQRINRSLRELPPRGSWHAKIWIGRGMFRGNYITEDTKHASHFGLKYLDRATYEIISALRSTFTSVAYLRLISLRYYDFCTFLWDLTGHMVRYCLQGLLQGDVSDVKENNFNNQAYRQEDRCLSHCSVSRELKGLMVVGNDSSFVCDSQDAPLEARSMCKVQNNSSL